MGDGGRIGRTPWDSLQSTYSARYQTRVKYVHMLTVHVIPVGLVFTRHKLLCDVIPYDGSTNFRLLTATDVSGIIYSFSPPTLPT